MSSATDELRKLNDTYHVLMVDVGNVKCDCDKSKDERTKTVDELLAAAESLKADITEAFWAVVEEIGGGSPILTTRSTTGFQCYFFDPSTRTDLYASTEHRTTWGGDEDMELLRNVWGRIESPNMMHLFGEDHSRITANMQEPVDPISHHDLFEFLKAKADERAAKAAVVEDE